MKRKIIIGLTVLALIFLNLASLPASILAASTTTSITITKHDAYGAVISTQTVTLAQLKAMSVVGDGTTHYYLQENIAGPSTQDTAWDVDETNSDVTIDMGTPSGTDVKDLCNLVGGASQGDTIKVSATDGFKSLFPYENVYDPQPRQGKLIIAWSNAALGGDIPTFADGLRLEFMAETTNAAGQHIYGLWDMHETLPSAYWGYTDGPSTSHMSVKWVSNIDIYEPNVVSCNTSGTTTENFVPGQTEYVKGTGLAANTTYKLWVQPDPVLISTIGSWQLRTGTATTLSTSADPSGSQETVITDANGDFSPTSVWNIPSSAASGTRWDIVADSQAAGTIGVFDGSDYIDDSGNAGFTVATSLPVAAFTTDKISGGVPLTVHFSDQSAGTSPISYAWDFDNNGTVDSTDPNPIYTFSSQGTYSVKLSITTADGANQIIKANYISVTAPQSPVAAFTASLTSGPNPLTVRFTDQSSGPPTSWAWDFNGDNVVDSTLQNPQYTYTTPGTYAVTLSVSNASGSNHLTQSGYITVSANNGNNPDYPWADWPLTISGYTTVHITRAQFEALAADSANTGAIYTDDNGNQFKGVSLWRLIAEVDGGNSTTLNTALIGDYSVKITGQNADESTYTQTFMPPYTGFDFYSSREDIILANQEEAAGTTVWTALPFSYINSKGNVQLSYPLLLTGSGLGSISFHVSAVTEIDLLNLPIQTSAPAWDLNSDHICNIGDVVKIGLYWGQTGTAGWIPEDVNNDGIINIGDVVVLGLHWGETW